MASGAGEQWSDACQAAIDDSLYSAALAVLLEDRDRGDAGASNNLARRQLALRAKALLHESDELPLTVSELCKSLGTSERMLELSFRAQFGVCARQFMIALRLQRAHRALATADSNTTVTSIATDLGFWHLGRFSHYYQQMFGVLPSSTLRLHPGSAIRAVTEWKLAIDSMVR
jgi:AraC family ethanolamine operon transcriptional activator